MIMKTIEFLWCYWRTDCWYGWVQEGSHGRGTQGFVMSCELSNVLRNGHWICERSDRRSATRTRANMGQCLRTLRARRPEPSETMHTRRVVVLHNMHISLDFNSVDFLGMLEVLGLQLIFMHRGNWRDFIWSYYCAFVSWWYCDGRTLIVWCVDSMSTVVLATAHVFFETHQGECHSTLGMRYGLSSRIEGVFPFRLVMLMFCGN